MTDETATDATDDATTATDDTAVAGEDIAADEVTEQEAPPSRREARYRRQLRDTEGERDALAAQLDAMRRSEVERIAGAVVAEPSALWAAEVALDDLLGEDGTVDPGKVTEAAEAARARLGLQPRRAGNVVPREGSNPTPSRTATFASAFAPR